MASRTFLHLPAVLLLGCTLSGCAERGSFPSLMPRAAEGQKAAAGANATAEVPGATTETLAPDEALAAQLAQLLARAREGQQAFERELEAARAAIARAGAPESESWIDAQQALSRLEAVRVPTVTALSDLDALAVSRSEAGIATSDSDRAAIAATQEQAGALAAGQEEEIASLSARIRAS